MSGCHRACPSSFDFAKHSSRAVKSNNKAEGRSQTTSSGMNILMRTSVRELGQTPWGLNDDDDDEDHIKAKPYEPDPRPNPNPNPNWRIRSKPNR